MRAFPHRAWRHPGDAGRRAGAQPRAATGCRRRCGTRRFDLPSRLAGARTGHPDGARRARRDAKNPQRRTGRGRRRCRHRAVDRLMTRIFVTQPVYESALARLRAVAEVRANPDARQVIPRDQLIAGVRGCDILFSLLHDRIDGEVIAANPKLRAIASMSITPDNIDVASATSRRIPVTVVPALAVESTADTHFALLLAVARRVVEGDQLVRGGIFPGSQANYLLGWGGHGKTIGLVGGRGRIGRAVAARAKGFSMRSHYCGPHPMEKADEEELGAVFVPLDRLLGEADFVSLHPRLTDETHHMIDARALALMKPTAFLINTAR